jgi:hypothetical protein
MRTAILVLAITLLMTVPAGVQAWAGKGSYEPDTSYDATNGWMYTGTDTTPCGDATCATGPNDVYFNGFLGQPLTYEGISFNSGTNPNFATVGSEIPTFPDSPKAMLGIWKDCNDDGYIGLGDNALFEYRTEVLNAQIAAGLAPAGICPVGAIPAPIPYKWMPVHNDGTWVHEFIGLGEENGPNPQIAFAQSPWNLVDEGARVWVDDGLPGGPPTGTCYTLNYPPGSFHTVGGIESVLDCYLTNKIENNAQTVCGATNTCAEWSQVKATGNPWGEENGGSMVTVWDCSQGPVATGPAVTNYHDAVNHPKVPPTVDPTGSPGGTANATGSGLTARCSPYFNSTETNPGATLAAAPYTAESNVNQINGVKLAPDFQMRFTEDTARPAPVVGSSLGRGSPGDGGIGQDVYGRGFWASNGVRALSRNPLVDRTLLKPQGVTVYSYYAFVSPQAISDYHLSLPKTPYGAQLTTGTYGAEACGSFTTGVHNEWACDPNAWYPNGQDGCTSQLENINYCAKVGDAYDMLDVDCYDYSVSALRSVGVGYGVLTGTSCS